MDEIKNMLKTLIERIQITISPCQEEKSPLDSLYSRDDTSSPSLVFHDVFDAYYSGRRDGTAILAKQILDELEKWGY